MSPQHTPGPWSVGPSAVVLGANGKRVCQLAVRIDEAELAYARLIAEAPAMLAVLREAHKNGGLGKARSFEVSAILARIDGAAA